MAAPSIIPDRAAPDTATIDTLSGHYNRLIDAALHERKCARHGAASALYGAAGSLALRIAALYSAPIPENDSPWKLWQDTAEWAYDQAGECTEAGR